MVLADVFILFAPLFRCLRSVFIKTTRGIEILIYLRNNYSNNTVFWKGGGVLLQA